MVRGSLAGRRVLVVEDEYFLAQELKRALGGAGAIVLGPAPSIADAMRLLEQEVAPDGAILDVDLGGTPAYPVADELIARGVPFLFTTGYDRAALPERYGSVCRLEKPVEATVTLRELERLLPA